MSRASEPCVECGSRDGWREGTWDPPLCGRCRSIEDETYRRSYQQPGGLRETQTWADHLRREAREGDRHEPPPPKVPFQK